MTEFGRVTIEEAGGELTGDVEEIEQSLIGSF
jgi:hypothetical protein